MQSSMAKRPTAPQPMEHLAGEVPARHVGLAVKRSQVFCPVTCPAFVIGHGAPIGKRAFVDMYMAVRCACGPTVPEQVSRGLPM